MNKREDLENLKKLTKIIKELSEDSKKVLKKDFREMYIKEFKTLEERDAVLFVKGLACKSHSSSISDDDIELLIEAEKTLLEKWMAIAAC